MNPDFEASNIDVNRTTFGVGRDNAGAQTFLEVPVNAEVKDALRQMLVATVEMLQQRVQDAEEYNPAERYSSLAHLDLPIDSDMTEMFEQLHSAVNLPLNANLTGDRESIFCYFAKFRDQGNRRITAMRRASQFKSLGRQRKLVVWTDNTLRIINDSLFKLDNEFDVLIDNNYVHILRPSGFEFTGRLQGAILDAVPNNIVALQGDVPYVDLSTVEDYASQHPRAARYLASIRTFGWAQNVNRMSLTTLCESTGVSIQEVNGRIIVPEDQVMGFLEVLDRRRYEIDLVTNAPEQFRATSRQLLT